MYKYTILASTYGQGNYNSSTYNGQTTTTGSGGGGSSNGGGVLSNTGFDVLLAVTAACLILFVALIVRLYKRPKTK